MLLEISMINRKVSILLVDNPLQVLIDIDAQDENKILR